MKDYRFLRRVATLIEQVEAGTIDYKRFYKDVKIASINAAYESKKECEIQTLCRDYENIEQNS